MATSKYQQEAINAKAEFAAYKAQIPEVMRECIAEYGLDICDEGLQDFCKRLGVDWSRKESCSATIYITGIGMSGTDARYGFDFDDKEYEAFYKRVEEAIKPIMSEFDFGNGSYFDLEVNRD